MKKAKWLIPFIAGVVITVLLGSALLGTQNIVLLSSIKYDHLTQLDEKYSKIDKLRAAIEEKFYIPIDDDTLELGMIRGLFEATEDKYSRYFTEEEYANYKDATKGKYYGIGVSNYLKNDEVEIVRVFENSPAETVGIQVGDKVVEVDGLNIVDHTTSELIDAMLGDEGTTVKVTVDRQGEELSFDIVRGEISIPFVTYKVIEDIGYVHIYQFGTNVSKSFKEALEALNKEDVKGLIIDVRDNPGGLVYECVKIADEIMDSGLIVYTLDRNEKKKTYKSDAGHIKLPIVFLGNERSASASEILLGAVKDAEVGPIIGTQTFGKGIVQSVNNLSDGTGYKLTYSQYYTPNGIALHKVGVKPDYEVEYDGRIDVENPNLENDEQLKKAIEVLNEKILLN